MQEKKLNPLKAIRMKCLDCVGGQRKEVITCDIEECTLHPYRFGKNPYRKKKVATADGNHTKRIRND